MTEIWSSRIICFDISNYENFFCSEKLGTVLAEAKITLYRIKGRRLIRTTCARLSLCLGFSDQEVERWELKIMKRHTHDD
jgi:hypothetical protein